MTIEEALVFIDTALGQETLSNVQELVFRQAWEGKTYVEIAVNSGYNPRYLGDIGFKLWQLLSQALGEKVTKNNFRSVLRQYFQDGAHGSSPLLTPPTSISQQNEPIQALKVSPPENSKKATRHYQDWGDALDVSVFHGRGRELITLEEWVVQDHCRLIAVLGMGGIGKTALVAKLAEQVQGHFEYVFWRSLRNAPPFEEVLTELLKFLANETSEFKTIDGGVLQLLGYLRTHRCLLILDNIESILEGGVSAGQYQEGYEAYGLLLRCVGETSHQSCLLLTSREKPSGFAVKEGKALPIRSLQLGGLQETEGMKLLEVKGSFYESEAGWRKLINYYAGNPLALRVIATAIQDVFEGDVSKLLKYLKQGSLVFNGIRGLLDQQFNRLSNLEKQIMYCLAVNRQPTSPIALEADTLPSISKVKFLEALESLLRRSLVEKSSAGFTQQPVVMEYTTEKLTEQVCQEIATEQVSLLNSQALLKVQAADYIRDEQVRLIIKPTIACLHNRLGSKRHVEHQLTQTLSSLGTQLLQPGYACSNILSLLNHLRRDLTEGL